MQLFWRQGYTATSLQQLLDTMSIGRSSLYAAFGDKRGLFVEALTLFSDRTNATLESVWSEKNPADAIRLFFECTLFVEPERRMRRGCMMVNSVLELADVDQGLSELAVTKLDKIENAFESCFARALEEGTFQSTQTPKQLAQFMMTLNQGMRVAARKNVPKDELLSIVGTTLSLLRNSMPH